MANHEQPSKQGLLLKEVEDAIDKYRTYRKQSTAVQWTVLISVTVAGFFTALAGGVELQKENPAWYANQSAIIAWGLIAAIGAVIVQTANPAKMAEKFEQKKDAMRAIRTALNYDDNFGFANAARLVQLARSDPAKVIDELLRKSPGTQQPSEV